MVTCVPVRVTVDVTEVILVLLATGNLITASIDVTKVI